MRELVVAPSVPRQIQEAWEDVLTDRINEFVLESVSEQRNRAEALEREWDQKDIELRRVEAERDALKNEDWKWCIVLAFALSLFIVGFIVVALLQTQVGGW